MLERRRHARVAAPHLDSLLGEVINLSATGLCLFHKGRLDHQLGDEVALVLGDQGTLYPLTARVCRISPAGFRRHELALEIAACPDATRAWLNALVARVEATPTDLPGPRCWLAA